MEVRKVYQKCRRPSSKIQEAPRIRSRLWLSGESRVSHAWLAACGAGDMSKVEVLLPIVEKTSLGNNCKEHFGMTGLMAALEKGW